MTLRQLELSLAAAAPAADAAAPEPWYLAKFDALHWELRGVELEEEHLVVLRCTRRDNPAKSILLYIPRYGRSVEDVYIEPNGHIRAKKTGGLLA